MNKGQPQLHFVRLSPKLGVVLASHSERAMGRILRAMLVDKPTWTAQSDLVGDIFFSLVKHSPKLRDNPPATRIINHAVMDWIMNMQGWDQVKASTFANIPASIAGAEKIWEKVMSNDIIKKAMERQAQIEELRREAMRLWQMAQRMRHFGSGDEERIDQAEAKAAELEQRAKEIEDELQALMERIRKNPLMAGFMDRALKEAKEEADKITGFMKSWGLEPGQVKYSEANTILQLARSHQDQLEAIAELIGRFKSITAKASEQVRSSYTGPVTEVAQTTDIRHLFPTERAYMSDQAPAYLKTMKQTELLIGGGLLGFKPYTEGEKFGAFLAMVDNSSSMSGQDETIAKAIAVGVSWGLQESKGSDKRYWELVTFNSYIEDNVVTSDDEWKKKIEWASKKATGGTDFDVAMKEAIRRLEAMHDRGIYGADLLFITDGESSLSDKTIANWKRLQEKMGARLHYVQIGSGGYQRLKAISETFIRIASGAFMAKSGEIVDTIVRNIIKGELKDLQKGDKHD